jgi:TP901 family phage tail tape measure protein
MAQKKEERLIELVMNSKQPQASIKDLEKGVAAMRVQLQGMAKDSKEAKEKMAEIGSAKKELKALNAEMNGVSDGFAGLKKQLTGFAVTAVAMAGFSAITGKVSSLIESNAKLSDQYADIRKTTGLTRIEVERLDSSLGSLNSRTSKSELRDIAIAAGQLGYTGDQILPFVNAMDKLNVALGDEFGGGAKQITTELGTLRNILTDIKSVNAADDMLKIGNAINVLSSEGAATAPVIADFANRIAGTGETLGLTSGQIFGLSATLQELGVSTERGGTAVTRIMQKMLTNTKEFASVAKMDIKSFTELLQKDLFGAFVKVMEGSKNAGKTNTVLAGIIKDLELAGAGASEIFGKLSANTDLLDKRVNSANDALSNTNSIMDEFNIKNDTLAAKLEKIQKTVGAWFTGAGWNAFINSSADLMLKIVGAGDNLNDSFYKQQKQVDALDKVLPNLIARHKELSNISEPSIEQQKELKSVIGLIAEAVPMAASEFDKYGKALKVNTNLAEQYLGTQKEIAEILKRQAIHDALQRMNEAKNVVTQANRQMKLLSDKAKFYGNLSDAEAKRVIDYQKTITDKTIEMDAAKAEILHLNGKKTSEEMIADLKEKQAKEDDLRIKKSEKETTFITTLSDEESKAHQKQLDKQRKQNEELVKLKMNLAEKLADIERELWKETLGDLDKELVDVDVRYNKLYEEAVKAKSGKDVLAKIDALNVAARQSVTNKFEKKATKNFGTWDEAVAAIDDDEEQQIAKGKKQSKKPMRKPGEMSDANKQKFDDAMKVAGQISGVWSSVNNLMAQQEDRELARERKRYDEKKANYDKLLLHKKITQKQYNDYVAKLDGDMVKKEKAIKIEQAKREKRLNIFNSIINTASAVVEALPNIPLSIAAGIAGGIQTGVIMAQPLPEFAKGGKTTFADGGNVGSARIGLIGERGPEWVAPNWMMNDPKTANVIGFLENYRRSGGTVRGYADGGSTSANQTAPQVGNAASASNNDLLQALNNNTAVMQQLMNKGVMGVWDYDYYTRSLAEINRAKRN